MNVLTAWAVGLVVPKLGAQGARNLLGLVAAGSRQVATLAAAIASRARPNLAQVLVKVPAARLGGRHEQWAGAGAGVGWCRLCCLCDAEWHVCCAKQGFMSG